MRRTAKTVKISTPRALLLVLCTVILSSCRTAHDNMPTRESCSSILHRIHAAKQMWALEHGKADNDIPQDAELFGETAYMRVKPLCPVGGDYQIGKVRELPKCSIPTH